MVPEAESLIDGSKLRYSIDAIEPKKASVMLVREFACVAQERLRDVSPLLVWINGDLVNERGRPIGHFRPKQAVF